MFLLKKGSCSKVAMPIGIGFLVLREALKTIIKLGSVKIISRNVRSNAVVEKCNLTQPVFLLCGSQSFLRMLFNVSTLTDKMRSFKWNLFTCKQRANFGERGLITSHLDLGHLGVADDSRRLLDLLGNHRLQSMES